MIRLVVPSLLFLWIFLTYSGVFGSAETRYADQVAVLMYHHVHDADTSSGTITTRLFHDQLAYLQTKGYHFISLDEFKQFMSGSPVPEKSVLVTFDDGYESFHANARPVIEQLKIPAVNFIITASLDHPQEDVPAKLSREQIRSMMAESKLMDVQCHTHAFHGKHDDGKAMLLQEKDESDEAYKTRIMEDTQACMKSLQELSPKAVDTMAYPFGIYNAKAADAVYAAGIQYAFTIAPGMVARDTDRMNIPRINAGSPNITPEGLERAIERRIVAVRK